VATPAAIMDALASQIETQLCATVNPIIPELQVDGRLIPSPTPPAIDVYPSDPFQEALGFGPGNKSFSFTVRARVSTSDNEAGQDLLLSMMDPNSSTSVAAAIESDRDLGSVVGNLKVEGPSGFGVFRDSSGEGNLLGCTWTVTVFP
jgi:hypothetical protein